VNHERDGEGTRGGAKPLPAGGARQRAGAPRSRADDPTQLDDGEPA
jgi:hypothetical protein